MKYFKKYYLVIYPILIVLFLFILDKIFMIEKSWIQTIGAIILAYILSPRKKIIKTETGKTKQITWLFLKKPIIIE